MRKLMIVCGLLWLAALPAAAFENCQAPARAFACGGQVQCALPGALCCGQTVCAPGSRCLACAGQVLCARQGSTCCGNQVCGPGQRCTAEAGGVICKGPQVKEHDSRKHGHEEAREKRHDHGDKPAGPPKRVPPPPPAVSPYRRN